MLINLLFSYYPSVPQNGLLLKSISSLICLYCYDTDLPHFSRVPNENFRYQMYIKSPTRNGNSLFLPRIEPRFPSRPTCIPATILTEPPSRYATVINQWRIPRQLPAQNHQQHPQCMDRLFLTLKSLLPPYIWHLCLPHMRKCRGKIKTMTNEVQQ